MDNNGFSLDNNLPDLTRAVVSEQELNAFEARQAEWFAQRNGKFTASEIHKILTYQDKPDEFPKGAETYVLDKVLEVLTDGKSRKEFETPAMQYGKEMEAEAIARVEAILGCKFEKTGDNQEFIPYGSHAGATPDGISCLEGLEVKCPDSRTHFFYLKMQTAKDLKRIKPEYYWQCQMGMLCAGFDLWNFASFDPRFTDEIKQIKIIIVFRDEADIEFLKLRLKMAISRKLELLNQ